MAATPPDEQRRLNRRWALEALAVLAFAAAGGILMALATPGGALHLSGVVVLGVSLTIGAGIVFYEIGRSEDRARAAGRH